MQEFILKTKKFSGYLKFGYNNGTLVMFENQAELTPEQLDYFEHNFPFRIENLEKIKGSTGRIEEVTDLSFEAFWNKYDYKVDKQQAENFWNKMSKGDRLAALTGINRYKTRCKMKNAAMIYPIRYLRNRRYEDE